MFDSLLPPLPGALPPPPTSIHFMGLGGIGVSGLARVLSERGYRVSGCDLVPGRLTDELAARGATVYQGHDPAHLDGIDLLVLSAAVQPHIPELAAAVARDLPTVKRADLLGLLLRGRRTIAVAGTHGKTTTSALIATILLAAGLDPTAFIGGEVPALGGNARDGHGAWAVAEADEYDRSFLQLTPTVAVLTNVEADHFDIYRDLSEVREAFARFIALLPPDGALIACADDPVALDLASAAPCRVVTYGFAPTAQWTAREVVLDAAGAHFTLQMPHAHDELVGVSGRERATWESLSSTGLPSSGKALPDEALGAGPVTVTTPLSGRHNVANALAALAAAAEAGVPPVTAARILEGVTAPRRRQEMKGYAPDGALVLDDYAHHPTEIRATLAGLRARYPGRRLRVAYQPHTYTRTRALLHETGASFGDADEVAIAEVYGAREDASRGGGVGGGDVVAAACQAGARATFAPTLDDVVRWLCRDAGPDVVLVTIGAGDIWKAGERVCIR